MNGPTDVTEIDPDRTWLVVEAGRPLRRFSSERVAVAYQRHRWSLGASEVVIQCARRQDPGAMTIADAA